MILRPQPSSGTLRPTYLVGQRTTREAILLDPGDDISAYLAEAERLGLKIRHVFASDYGRRVPFGLLELREQPHVHIHQSDAAPFVRDALPLVPERAVTVGALRVVLVRDEQGAEYFVVVNLEGGTPRLALRTRPQRAA